MLKFCGSRLVAFDTLLCGPAASQQSALFLDQASGQFRRRTEFAPLPLPLAVHAATQNLKNNNPAEVLTIVSGHPDKERLIRSIAQQLGAHCSLIEHMRLLKMLKKFDPSLETLAFVVQCAAEGSQTAEGVLFSNERELLRDWIVRFVRYHPTSATLLLKPLCFVSDLSNNGSTSSDKKREDILEVAHQALRSGFIAADVCGLVLKSAHYSNKVLHLWSWMKHTSAKWNKDAASSAVTAMSRQRRFGEAVATLQTLAAVNVKPTAEAQISFMNLLAHTVPPLPDYGDQLMTFWYNTEEQWEANAVEVKAAQIFLHFRCGSYYRCLDLMVEAAEHFSTSFSKSRDDNTETSFIRFISSRGMYHVTKNFFDDISSSDLLLDLFFNFPLSMIEEFANRSTVLGIIVGVGRRREARSPTMENVLVGLKKIKNYIDDTAFEKLMQAVAEDYSFNSSQETLQLMNDIASAVNKKIPAKIIGWVKLL